jgi:thymidylate kinase
MSARPQITIFEGPDGAGKSTLVREFAADHPDGATAIHHGPYAGIDEIAPTYFASMLPAYLDRRSVVLDRSWVSEPIYAYVYRGNRCRVSAAQARILERLALARSAVVVVCLPPLARCLENWRVRHARGAEYLETEAHLERVWELYREYLASRSALPRVTFDYTTETFEDLTTKVDAARGPANPGPGVGAWRPGAVALLVGDRPSTPPGVGPSRWKFPFGGLTPIGCSLWLADALDAAGIGEDSLYWVNAYDAAGAMESMAFAAALRPRATFALGFNAAAWCAEAGLDAVTTYHPQYWKRFHASTPYPLIKELSHALR